jgi:hypothetical protein
MMFYTLLEISNQDGSTATPESYVEKLTATFTIYSFFMKFYMENELLGKHIIARFMSQRFKQARDATLRVITGFARHAYLTLNKIA